MGPEPLQLHRVDPVPVVAGPKPLKPFTLRRSLALALIVILVPSMCLLAIILGAIYGGIVGVGKGMADALRDVHRDLSRWWGMYEQGK